MKQLSIKPVIALLLISVVTGCTTISDWFKDDDEIAIRRLQPIDEVFEVDEVWDASVGSGITKFFSRLQPVESNGLLFVADRRGYLAALDITTGKRKWRRDFAVHTTTGWQTAVKRIFTRGQTARLSSLSVHNDKVFLGTENGDFMALNPEDGSTIWETKIAGEILAPATADQGIVVVNTGSGVLFAVSEENGELLWQTDSDVPPLTLRGISAPHAEAGGVVVGTPTGFIQVNVLENGLTAWETAIAKPAGATELERIVDIDATPLVYRGIIYAVSFNGTLASVELRSGRVIWQREYGSFRNITLRDNSLFLVDTNSNILALDRRNGVERWSQNSIKGRRLTSAVPFGEHVVVGDNYGFLHWINAETGAIESRYNLGKDDEDGAIYSDPIVVDDVLIAVTREGDVAALKPQLAN